MWIVASVSCSQLIGMAFSVVFCSFSSSASRFDVNWFRNGLLPFLVYTFGCWSCCSLSIIYYHPGCSSFTQELPLAGYFLCFWPFSYTRGWFFVTAEQPCCIQSDLNPLSSSFWCSVWASAGCLGSVYLTKYIKLLPCGWLMSYSPSRAVKRMYFMMWPVRVI